jgi:hypothetical protein
MRRATVTQDGAYFDTVANGMHAQLAAMPLPARTLTWSPDGDAPFQAKGRAGDRTTSLARNGALTKANVSYTISGALAANGA